MADDTTNDTPAATTDAKPAPRPLVYEITGKIRVPVVNTQGESAGTVEVDPAEFSRDGTINRQLMHEVVLMYLANQRAGTHSTLRRGQVAGSTKKLFRQKGTGNARAGTKRTNKRKGGGTAKGPKPRDYEYHLPKKAVRSATRMALLSKFADGEAVVLDGFTAPERPKTKAITAVLDAIKVPNTETTLNEQTVLIGTAATEPNTYLSARNLPNVRVLPAAEFNCYTVLRQKRLVLTRGALEVLLDKARGNTAAGSPPRPEKPAKLFPRKKKRKEMRLARRAKALAAAK